MLITLNENLHNKNAYHFMKLKKERLIQISVLSHHYLNSLYALFGSYSTVSAQVILRAMIELHINSSYMYLTPNNENLNKLMVSEIELGLKGVKSLLSIYKKSGRKTATKTYQSTYKLLVSRKKHWGGIPAPSVIERARQYDKKRNSTLLEEGYLFWYGKFSAPVHANSTILNRLMRGKAITIVGMLEDFQEVIELACMHHLSILELLDIKVNKNRKTTKLMFQKFDKILETPRYKTTA